MSQYQNFKVETADGIATITMDREPLNVLNNAMMAEFNAVLETILADDNNLAAVVIRAEGKAFCAGVDVSDHSDDKVGEMIKQFHGIFRKLASTDALTIAVVQGAALGGGCELACFCDIVLASARAKFGQPEVKVGVVPPVAACVFPPQIGIKKAIELNAVGMAVGADEAKAIGLVNQVYPVETFNAEVKKYLDQISELSRPVVRAAKQTTCLLVREQILQHLERTEEIYLNDLMKLEDAHEGIAAFMEKRPPSWKHA